MCFKAAKPTITKWKQRCTTLHEGKKRRLRCSFTARVNTRSRQPSMRSRTNVPGRSNTASKPWNSISYRTVLTTSCTVRKKTQIVCVLLRRHAAKNTLHVVPVPQVEKHVSVCVFFFSFLPYVEGMAIFSSSLTFSNHFWYREIFTCLVFLQNDLRFRIWLCLLVHVVV